MLADIDATAMLAVKDVKVARAFYEDTLGLPATDSGQDGMVGFVSGKTQISLYESDYARTNKSLRDRGVTFERYDLPGLAREGDVHVADNFKAVWFTDPDGNILHVNGQ